MKKTLFIIWMTMIALSLPAESIWTGNAAVGDAADFPGASESFRAASNSFPAGTVLRVTNPRGGGSVEVIVSGRLNSPGVFVLLERPAAEVIGLPSDHVIPVRVTPLSGFSAQLPVSPVAVAIPEDRTATADTDYNPAGAETPEAAPDTAVILPLSTPDTTGGDTAGPETVAEGEPVPAGQRAGEVAEPEETAEFTETADPEEIAVYDLAAGETPAENAAAADSANRIFFLLPAEPRPPEVTDTEAAGQPAEIPVAVRPEKPVAEEVPTVIDLPLVRPGAPGYFIQIGSYRNRVLLEQTAEQLRGIAPGYPVGVAISRDSLGEIYRLLIGPIGPAERGAVLRTARTSVFPDAFPYQP